MRKRLALLALLAVVAVGCGSTTADTVGLHYNGGPLEGESFETVVAPGSGQKFLGPSDRLIRIPINKRDYTFCAPVRPEPDEDGCDGGPVKVTALRGAELAFSGGLSFVIATGNEDTLREFYEQLCRKFKCADEDGLDASGWAELLRVNVRGPLEDTLQEVVRGYTVDAIYAGTPSEAAGESEEAALSTLTAISNRVEELMRDTLNEFAGGEFFCGPAYSRAKPKNCPNLEFIVTEVTPDKETRQAFARNVAASQRIIDAQSDADAAREKARGEKDAADILASLAGIPGYVEYLRARAMEACAQNPKCTLIFTPAGSEVNVQGGPR